MLELDGYDSSEDAKSEHAPSVGGDDLASADDDDDGHGMDIDGVDQDCLFNSTGWLGKTVSSSKHCFDTEQLPPRASTGARLQLHAATLKKQGRRDNTEARWQGWYDKCPRTGKPIGVNDHECQCAGTSRFFSSTAAFGPHAAFPDSESARKEVVTWIRQQHHVHSPTEAFIFE